MQTVRLRCFLSASGSKFTYITFFWPSVGFGVLYIKIVVKFTSFVFISIGMKAALGISNSPKVT